MQDCFEEAKTRMVLNYKGQLCPKGSHEKKTETPDKKENKIGQLIETPRPAKNIPFYFASPLKFDVKRF